jgi:hypothetical protein
MTSPNGCLAWGLQHALLPQRIAAAVQRIAAAAVTVQIRMKHKDTNTYLSSNKDLMFGQPIHGHLEVCGVPSKGKDTEWYAAEGVYLPRTDASKKSKGAAAAAGKEEEKDEL